MNIVSIFEQSWLDLVFEGKNKSYGAYQLRRENSRTTLLALLFGLLLIAALAAVPYFIGLANPQERIATPTEVLPDVILVEFDPIQPKQPDKAIAPVFSEKEPDETVPLIDPEIVPETEADPNITKNADLANSGTETNTGEEKSPGAPSTPGTEGLPAPIPTNNIERTVSLDRQPEFPGGIKKFYQYVGDNFRSVELDEDKAIRVFVSFVIEKDGTMTDIKVAGDPDNDVGTEAIRVLKSLKAKWSPGIIKGNPVRTQYSLPITVKL